MAKSGNVIGSWAFLIGVVLALIFGFLGELGAGMTTTLVIIGLIIGLLNIADAESSPFLMSGAVLIIASSLGDSVVGTVTQLSGILKALLAVFVPATIVVAVRSVFSLAKR